MIRIVGTDRLQLSWDLVLLFFFFFYICDCVLQSRSRGFQLERLKAYRTYDRRTQFFSFWRCKKRLFCHMVAPVRPALRTQTGRSVKYCARLAGL